MDVIKKKHKDLRKYLKGVRTTKKAVNVVNYCEYAKDVEVCGEVKTVWTDAFRIALQENEHVYIPNGTFYIDTTVVIPSDRRITAAKNAHICMVKDAKLLMMRNADVIDGSYRAIGKDEPRSKNIFIEGGVWEEDRTSRLGYGKSGAFDENDSFHGVTCLLFFSGVDNLWLKNMKFTHTGGFAVQIGRTENFLVEDLEFEECFADGVHVNGDVKRGMIINIKGETGDDLVALNAYDWANSTINNGPMNDITVCNVMSLGQEFHLLRMQPGIMPDDKGGMDCYMKDIHLRNIKGVNIFKMYLQTPSYKGLPDGTKVGWMENVVIEDLDVTKDTPSDSMNNYKNGDPVTGHFGVFELSSNIKNLTLKNINVKLNIKDYPETAHFIVAGPKCSYLEDVGVEIFDPYVVSEVQEILYKNITINGKKIKDLREVIKEVSYDNLYPSELGFGHGKVVKVTEL